MKFYKIFILLTFLFWLKSEVRAQDTDAYITGYIFEPGTEKGIGNALVNVLGSTYGVETDETGYFQLKVESNKAIKLKIRRIGFDILSVTINKLSEGETREIKLELNYKNELGEVVITSDKLGDKSMIKANVNEFKLLPSVSGNVESLLPSIALGTSSGSGGELTSQYNVRGGNYDENLVYINDFEIFRPQLIRNGQQEGLSFANIDLIRDLSFSSGGFDSKYGDKLSSVLDIKYKRAEKFQSSASASLLGSTAHLEGSLIPFSSKNHKLRYLLGARYKTTKYILGSQEIVGEYAPNFVDFQAFVTYDFSSSLQLGIIGNYNNAKFNFTPESRTTVAGTIFNPFQFSASYEGKEIDEFNSKMVGASLSYLFPNKSKPAFIKLLISNVVGQEAETYDILSYFRISILSPDFEAGQLKTIADLGQGIEHKNARNYLQSAIKNVELKGGIEFPRINIEKELESSHFIYAGIKMQKERFYDNFHEWIRKDSAGYSTPFYDDNYELEYFVSSKNDISSVRISSFIQETFSFTKLESYEFQIVGGSRFTYWSFNDEWLVSPRGMILFRPLGRFKNTSYKLAGGIYSQQPFYREIRMPNGELNDNIIAQKSQQIIAGFTYDFNAGKAKPLRLRFISEIYYKRLFDLISYDVDNVRVRYSGKNDSKGYSKGIDLRLNGDFVNGVESWINVSIMDTKEKISGVTHKDISNQVVEFVPRPTNRSFNASIYFQDYLPNNTNFKTNIQISYGSGLPYSTPGDEKTYRNVFNYKDYQRVDIGFSYVLWDETKRFLKPNSIFKWSKNAWISAEIYNLMDVNNQSSTSWVKDFNNFYYSVPNRLTTRRLNLKIRVEL